MKLRQRAFVSMMKTCMCCYEHNITNYRISRYVALACQRTWRSEEARSNDKSHKLSPEEFLLNLHNSRRNEQKNVPLIFKKHDEASTTKNEQLLQEAEETTKLLPHKVKESTLANVEELLNDYVEDDKSDVNDTNKNTMHERICKFVTDQFNVIDKKDSWESFCNEAEYLATEPSVSEEFTLPTIIEEKELENRTGSSEDDLFLQNILLDSQEGLNLQEVNSIADSNTTNNQSDNNIVNFDSKLTSFEPLETSSNIIDNDNGAENVVINAAATAEDNQANVNTSEQFTCSVDENCMDSIADREINDENDNEMESETRIETEELNDIEESDASETELIDEMLSSPLPSFALDDLLHSLEQGKRSSDAHSQQSSTSTNCMTKISKDNSRTNNSYDDYIRHNDQDEFAKMSMTFDNQEVTSVEVNSLGEGLQSKNN